MINLLHETEMKVVEKIVDHILDERDLKDRQKTLLHLRCIL